MPSQIFFRKSYLFGSGASEFSRRQQRRIREKSKDWIFYGI